jgi:hypothetical protein
VYFTDDGQEVYQYTDETLCIHRFYYATVYADNPSGSPALQPPTSMELVPSETTISPGMKLSIAVIFRNNAGQPVASLPVTWSSDNSGVASVDGDGQVTGNSEGSTRIYATASNGSQSFSGFAQITVVSADSLCGSSADSRPTYAPGTTFSSILPAHGPLQSLAMQDAIGSLSSRPGKPEHGGPVTLNTQTHAYGFFEIPNAETDLCHYSPEGGHVDGVNRGFLADGLTIVVAYAHGHPQQGQFMSEAQCPGAAGNAVAGPSDADRSQGDAVANFTDRNYVVQRDINGVLQIYTYGTSYDPNSGTHVRVTDDTWTQQGINRCFAHVN